MSREEDLVAAYLDDSLTDEQSIRLQAWLEADAANVRQFVLANAREEQLREAVMSSSTLAAVTELASVETGNTRRRFRSPALVLCTAAVILAAVTAWYAAQQNDREFVTLVRMSGLVSLRSDNGATVGLLKRGAHVAAGTIVVEGEGARAEFAFADRSILTLSGGTELTMGEGSGKQMFLQRGTLLASVSRQPADHPLRIRTPTAEAVVLGTSFVMNTVPAETFLRVTSGAVELRRLADDQALKVSEHEQARAGITAIQPMRPEPIASLPVQWRAVQGSSQVTRWLGKWRPGATLTAVPRTVFVAESGVEENHYHAGAMVGFPGLVTLRDDSAVRVRYRIRHPLNVGIFLVTHTESWAFAGNFQAYIEQRKTPADADGWRTATVPMKAFMPIRVNSMPFTQGCIASTIFVTTYADDVGLEVAEFEVISPEEKE